MGIRTKSLDVMVREVIDSLKAGEPGQPVFSLLLGSGFSVPIIPTPSQMLKDDIPWWRYWKQRRMKEPFCQRTEAISRKLATEEEITEFEREMWTTIHGKAAERADTAFALAPDGLPDLSDPTNIGLAYQGIMAHGLISNKMRRHYLRDAIERTYPRVNAAHIFLAGILEAQETEEWKQRWGAPFCRTIFTTNFDPLLQRSLQLVNKLYYMSDRPDVLEPPDDDESDAAVHLVYTHGSVHRYDLRNTGEQIKDALERNAPALVTYFQRHGVIVIGYSGWEDTTMAALERCPSFDSNLYWCDIHPLSVADQRLRPEVLNVLRTGAKNAFYVPITDAGEAMRLLHRELNLGDVPKFILDPVGTMIVQLESIEVPPDPTVSATSGETIEDEDLDDAKTQAAPFPGTLVDLRNRTLTLLRIAKSAYDNPKIVQPNTQQGRQDIATAIAANLLSDAFAAYSQGKRNEAITLWNSVIKNQDFSAADRATAQVYRGFTRGEAGEIAEAINDFTAVIEMADAPPEQKAKALNNRGVNRAKTGEAAKEVADFTEVIEMADAPAEWKAKALINRGLVWAQRGEAAKEITDYTTVIEMADAPVEQRAKALYNRALAWSQAGEMAKEIADYTTAIEIPDAPAEWKARALYNRGVRWGESGHVAKEIADYTAVVEMADVPNEQKLNALNNRGVVWGDSGETAKAIADHTAVIEMADAPDEDKALAFLNRGWRRFANQDDARSMVEDSRAALALVPDERDARANLALGLLLTGEIDAARAEYETLLSTTSDAKAIQSAIDDLEAEMKKHPDLPSAPEILDLLRAALPPAA